MNQLKPHDLETERQILGAVLKNPTILDEVVQILSHTHAFYSKMHQIIYRAILNLYHESESIDILTVAAKMGAKNLEKAGGKAFLEELVKAVGTTAHATAYAKIIKDKAALRQLINLGQQIIDVSSSEGAKPTTVIEQFDKALLEMSELGERTPSVSVAGLSDRLAERILSGEPAYSRDDYLLTRVDGLNARIVGLFRGDLIVVCAPPSGGKTSFALDVGFYNAILGNHRVVYYAIDETQSSIVQRLYCSSTGLPRRRFADGQFTNKEMEAIRATDKVLKSVGDRFHIADNLRNLTEIRLHARRHKRQHGLDLVIIDYLQQVALPTGRRSESRNLELTEIVRQLKELAKELHIPVVVVSQFNRRYEADAPRIEAGHLPLPQLTWLRDSGSIEQEANLVLGMFVPGFILKAVLGEHHVKTKTEFVKNGSGILDAKIVIMKDKMGGTGSISCKFSCPRMQFFSPVTDLESQPEVEINPEVPSK